MLNYLNQFDEILILGFGAEGKSTYQFIRNLLPTKKLAIADQKSINKLENPTLANDQFLIIHEGANYLQTIDKCSLIFESPGISFKNLDLKNQRHKITSQIDFFLRFFGKQTIGITGTKGKSTTTSLIYHVLKSAGKEAFIAGNIGKPVLELISDFTPNSIAVIEMSSHQLEFVNHAPHIGLLLNIYPEHLDHYNGFDAYK